MAVHFSLRLPRGAIGGEKGPAANILGLYLVSRNLYIVFHGPLNKNKVIATPPFYAYSACDAAAAT